METTVAGEVKAAVEKVQTEGKFRLEIVQKEFEGERNILQGRIASLETVLNDQSAHLIKLNDQVEKSYSQVQAIAVKAVRARRRRLLQLFSRSSSRGNSSSVGHVEHLKRDRFDAGSRLERLSVMVLPTVVMDGGEWPEL
jgi:hypothetical protein